MFLIYEFIGLSIVGALIFYYISKFPYVFGG